MKNILIKVRYGINNEKFFLFIKKIIKNRKNIFVKKIFIKNLYIYNINIKKNFFLVKNFINFKLIILFGGDGSIINTIKKFFFKNFFFKCINLGNLGFLSNNNIKKNFLIYNFFGNILIFKKKIEFSLIFINEIIFKKKNLKIKIKNSIFYCDSIIITSSYGSTGYFFSIKKLIFYAKYLIFFCIFSHTNKNIFFFFKKIKIVIHSEILLLLDCIQEYYIKKKKILIFIKKKFLLNNLKKKIYDK